MHYFIALFFVSLLAGCSQQISISQDYLPDYDFASVKSYQFLAMDDKNYTSLNKNRVENALKQTLKAKGLTFCNKACDVTVAFMIYQQEKQRQRVTTTNTGNMYYGRSYFGPSVNFGTTYVDNIDYQVGNLIIDIVDNKSRQVVYHSVASSEIIEGLEPNERDLLIQQAVSKALANFPPEQAK